MSELPSLQSPINIKETVPANKCEKLKFEYSEVNPTVTFDGHAVKATFIGQKEQNLEIDVNGVSNKFNLKQFHFHTPAEHAIDGAKKPMEVHLVHQFSALSEYNAVISVMIESATDSMMKSNKKGYFDNNFLKCIIDKASNKPNQDLCDKGIDVNDLIPQGLRGKELDFGFLTYHGSLTTPPFTENVHWILLKESLYTTPEIIEQFKSKQHDNARDIHPPVYDHGDSSLCSAGNDHDEL